MVIFKYRHPELGFFYPTFIADGFGVKHGYAAA